MKKQVSFIFILSASFCMAAAYPLTRGAHAMTPEECYQGVLADCGISNPLNDENDCFEAKYNTCINLYCVDECSTEYNQCHSTCFNACSASFYTGQCADKCANGYASEACQSCVRSEGETCLSEDPDCCLSAETECHENCPAVETCATQCAANIDLDKDGAADGSDPCFWVYSNEPYYDTDADGVGDACDPDIDGDGYPNDEDSCPFVFNQPGDNTDEDGDGILDTCDLTDIRIGPDGYTPLTPVITAGPELAMVETESASAVIDPGIKTYTAWAFDISSEDTERIVGLYTPETANDTRQYGFIWGDDPATDDAVNIDISQTGGEDTALWGIYDASNYVGQVSLNDITQSIWIQRNEETGTYTYRLINPMFQDITVSYSSAWDYALAGGVPSIVGRYADAYGDSHGYLYQAGAFTSIDVKGADETNGCGINNQGKIVGYYKAGDTYRGFLLEGAALESIHVPDMVHTWAYRINGAGDICGFFLGTDGMNHGFVYSASAKTYRTLDIDGAKDTFIHGINDAGKLVGYYRDASGTHSFAAAPLCRGDLDGDNHLDANDLAAFARAFGRSGNTGPGDINPFDNDVDGSDLAAFTACLANGCAL